MTVLTENTTSPESTKSRKSHSVQFESLFGTNSDWDFALMTMWTENIEFLDLVDFGGVAFSGTCHRRLIHVRYELGCLIGLSNNMSWMSRMSEWVSNVNESSNVCYEWVVCYIMTESSHIRRLIHVIYEGIVQSLSHNLFAARKNKFLPYSKENCRNLIRCNCLKKTWVLA